MTPEEELTEIEKAAGLWRPVWEQELIGYATTKIVLDEPLPVADWLTEDSLTPTAAVNWHFEPCDPIPQYRRVLRWHPVYVLTTKGEE